jgi:hypothetical protein
MGNRPRRQRSCRDDQRTWNERCVDKNLQDDWLIRLNGLDCFDLISICEGHLGLGQRSQRRTASINLRMKNIYFEKIAYQWEKYKTNVRDNIQNTLDVDNTNYELELKFSYRNFRNRLSNNENLSIRINCTFQRNSKKIDDVTFTWFDKIVSQIEKLDGFFGNSLINNISGS